MSAISSIGQQLYQFLQNITANSQSQAASATSATDATDATAAGTATSQLVQGAGHHHHHGGHGGMIKKIEQAVTDALNTASSSGSTSDPNTTIEDAIASVFKNSLDASSTSTSATTTNAAATDSNTNATSTASNGSATGQAFFQMLQSIGVDPQQFRQDFLAAMKDAQNGQVNPSTAFKGFPAGTLVDETA